MKRRRSRPFIPTRQTWLASEPHVGAHSGKGPSLAFKQPPATNSKTLDSFSDPIFDSGKLIRPDQVAGLSIGALGVAFEPQWVARMPHMGESLPPLLSTAGGRSAPNEARSAAPPANGRRRERFLQPPQTRHRQLTGTAQTPACGCPGQHPPVIELNQQLIR